MNENRVMRNDLLAPEIIKGLESRNMSGYYAKTKEKALAAYADRKTWAKMTLVNIAKAGFFSSDRTIGEYNKDIWKLQEEK